MSFREYLVSKSSPLIPLQRGNQLLILMMICASVLSCKKKNKTPEPEAPATLQHGILVLNEGLFNLNNASLSFVNTNDHTINNTFFEEKTGRGLGDTGNDMERYGDKIYIIVNVSSTLEILDAKTGDPVSQISMISNGTAQQPRSIAFYGSKAFVSCFDGFVSVIDTASLTVTQRIQVGSNPEGVAVSNGKLYVANSGGLNTVKDSTVSVINLSSMQEIKRITVGINPGSVCADAQGDIYVVSRGNYSSVPMRMHRIDVISDTKAQTFGFDAGGITRMNNNLLISYYDFNNGNSAIGLFNAQTETMTNASFISTSGIETLYGVHYSPVTNKVYCFDANGYTSTGSLNLFSATGVFERKYNVGLNPCKIIVYE